MCVGFSAFFFFLQGFFSKQTLKERRVRDKEFERFNVETVHRNVGHSAVRVLWYCGSLVHLERAAKRLRPEALGRQGTELCAPTAPSEALIIERNDGKEACRT